MSFNPKATGEEADQMIADLNQPGDQPPVEEQVAEQEAAITSDDVPSAENGVSADGEVVTTEVVDDPPEGNPQLADMQKQLDTAEHRWQVLQGMINKKDEEIDSMRKLLAQLSSDKAGTPPTENAPTPEPVGKLFTDADVEEYDEGLPKMVQRIALAAVDHRLQLFEARMAEKLGTLETSVDTTGKATANTAKQLFYTALTEAVPDWRALNTDTNFLAWLDETDVLTGASRLELLQHAVGSGDVGRAAAFFDTFKQAMAPAASAAPTATPASAGKEGLAAPGKGKTTTQVAATEKRTWSRDSISKLYDDRRTGKITDKEFNKLERDLWAAQSDGRVVG